jgi:uncharacterized C2H2 Zn-finger protein
MAAASASIEKVCPFPEELTLSERDIPCPVQECGKIFKHRGMLKMHMVKTHKIINNEQERKFTLGKCQMQLPTNEVVTKQFHCPEHTCPYHINSSKEKSFKTLFLLQKHFQRMHTEKTHFCARCGFGFAVSHEFNRHSKICGVSSECPDCGSKFENACAFKNHMRKHGKSGKQTEQITLKTADNKLIHTIIQDTLQFVSVIDNSKFVDINSTTSKILIPKPSFFQPPPVHCGPW